MQANKSRPPSLVAKSQSPETIVWPSVPQHTPQRPLHHSEITLPDLKSVLSPEFQPPLSSRPPSVASPYQNQVSPSSVRSLPRIEPGYANSNGTPRGMDIVMESPVETGSVMSTEERAGRATSVASMHDPDERSAAEALSALGNLDFARQSRGQTHGRHVSSHASPTALPSAADARTESEPLLELVHQAHPWIGGTIKSSLSAYSTTKYYSPRIVQYGVGLVERNIGTPIVGAVTNVSERTGVETALRRHLDARRPNDIEQGPTDTATDGAMEIDARDTTEQLPAYGASRPPSYREEQSPASANRSREVTRPPHNRTWSSQLIVTTSGLSVALSTTSRRSLRYCLGVLRYSFESVEALTRALSIALSDYEQNRQRHYRKSDSALEKGERVPTPDRDDNARRLAAVIKQHCDSIWNLLRDVSNAVSNYAGGALPQNAREFVRAQLMSLPQRWRIVSAGQSAESETSRSAQRMIDFAKEGLDMMTQVSGALSATLQSAEDWLASVGRRDDQADQPMSDAYSQQPQQSQVEKS